MSVDRTSSDAGPAFLAPAAEALRMLAVVVWRSRDTRTRLGAENAGINCWHLIWLAAVSTGLSDLGRISSLPPLTRFPSGSIRSVAGPEVMW